MIPRRANNYHHREYIMQRKYYMMYSRFNITILIYYPVISHFSAGYLVFLRYCNFYELRVCGKPVPIKYKSIHAISLIACVNVISLCHIVGILIIFHSYYNSYSDLLLVICDDNVIFVGCHELWPQKKVN